MEQASSVLSSCALSVVKVSYVWEDTQSHYEVTHRSR